MGNWGVGIFEGDFELDFLEIYNELRARGHNPEAAGMLMVETFLIEVDAAKYELGTVVIAAAQLISNELTEEWRDGALTAIEMMEPGDRLLWADLPRDAAGISRPGAQINLARQKVLWDFHDLLLCYDEIKPLLAAERPHYLHLTSLNGCSECSSVESESTTAAGKLDSPALTRYNVIEQVRKLVNSLDEKPS
jgi:hypothetical protein